MELNEHNRRVAFDVLAAIAGFGNGSKGIEEIEGALQGALARLDNDGSGVYNAVRAAETDLEAIQFTRSVEKQRPAVVDRLDVLRVFIETVSNPKTNMNVFSSSYADFTSQQLEVMRSVNLAGRFPHWSFRDARGYAHIFEYDRIVGGGFGLVLDELARAHGDELVTVVGVEPDATYYHDEYGFFPAFACAADDLHTGYGRAMHFEPGGDPTGALGNTLNVLGIAGSSHKWSLFAQRDWEVGVLLTPERYGPWLELDAPAFEVDVDLDSIRSPEGWGLTLSRREKDWFIRNLNKYGKGTS